MPPAAPIHSLQVGGNSHAVAVDQHHRWQPVLAAASTAKDLEVAQIRQTVCLRPVRPVKRWWKRGEYHCRVVAMEAYQFIEDEMLCSARQVVEGQRKAGA